MWALIGSGAAQAAVAQEQTDSKPQPLRETAARSSAVERSHTQWWQSDRQPAGPATAERRAGPWLPEPWQSAQADPVHKLDLSDQHVIAVSTLTLILVGVIVLLLVT
jgi:hypothetical protein